MRRFLKNVWVRSEFVDAVRVRLLCVVSNIHIAGLGNEDVGKA